MKKLFYFLAIFSISILFWNCSNGVDKNSDKEIKDTVSASKKHVPEWTKNLNIYEVNLRQYSESGKFSDFEKHLARLKEMGVDILWFMPINTIGIKNRKGTLGSYYSVMDYKAVNPEFGTMEEWKALVKKIHSMGMYVIIDWVANHTSWDNKMITEHPEWYSKDSTGKIISPVPDWKDVADLDYSKKELCNYMIDAMAFWLKESDIDGFRCDVSGMVPVEFWNAARPALDKIKPVFMLAEDEGPAMHEKAFDMTYTWEFHHICSEIAKEKKSVSELDSLFTREVKKFPSDAYRMYFTSNHDENSWNGTSYEKFGEGLQAFTVLTYIVPGMPLIYNGQEAGMKKRLQFFDKDPIEWKADEMDDLFKKLIALKKANPCLWNGDFGGSFKIINIPEDKNVFAMKRTKENNEVFAFINLSKNKSSFSISDESLKGNFKNFFAEKSENLNGKYSCKLNSWKYILLVKNK